MSLVDRVLRLTDRTGIEIRRTRRQSTEMSARMVRLFAQLGTDLVIDVGANRGQFSTVLRDDLRFAGRIVAFEPTAEAFGVAERTHSSDDLWSGRHEALGSISGQADINVFTDDQFSSFLRPNDYGATRWSLLGRRGRTETVEVRRLDEVWLEIVGASRSPFLKIDTQGRDLDVLAGASGVLHHVNGLLTEVPVKAIYDGVPPFPSVMEHLLDLGYEVVGLWPESEDDQLRVIEYNCLLRRT